MPEPPKSVSTEHATKVATESEMALDAQEKAAAAGNKKELAKIQKARKALAKKFKAGWGKGQAEPLVLVEEPSPPPAPMMKQTQTDIGKILAALTLTQEEGAKEIVRDARREGPTDQVLLAEIFDEFGKDALDGVGNISAKIEAIGKQAGLEKDDLDRHVAERKAQLAEKVVHARRADRSHRA